MGRYTGWIALETGIAGGADVILIPEKPLSLREIEKRYVLKVLQETKGNKKRASEILGIDRATLYRLLEKEGL
jgi:6-phosphofructokinase